ncbi:hypothetical protein BDZ97DRAFT_1111365 [Flammula alnicola]|nr:hypothetical protein BDZ97DRAFT_1111365 [Flammula alnicola]
MPTEQSPTAYYHYYLASQRRVERWVQETGRELQETSPAAAKHAPAKEQESPHVDPRPRASHRTSSSKHRTHESRSHSRPSSGSKKIKTDKVTKGVSSHHARGRTSRDSSFSTYLPYGILPLLFAMTGSSALSIVIAVILLAFYIYSMEDSTSPTKEIPS